MVCAQQVCDAHQMCPMIESVAAHHHGQEPDWVKTNEASTKEGQLTDLLEWEVPIRYLIVEWDRCHHANQRKQKQVLLSFKLYTLYQSNGASHLQCFTCKMRELLPLSQSGRKDRMKQLNNERAP